MSHPKPNHIIGMTYLEFGIVVGLGMLAIALIGGFTVILLLRNQPVSSPLAIAPSQTPYAIATLPDTPEPFSGKWKVYTSTSAFDGSKTVALDLDAENFVQGWLTTTLPTLVLRCKEGQMNVYVNNGTQPNVEYGLYNSATVRIRFDQNQAFESIADQSTDGNSLFLRDPYGMIMAMLQNREMVFGFTPFNANPAVITFDLDGLANVIEPLKQSCNWNGERPTLAPLPTMPLPPTGTDTPIPLPSGSLLVIHGIGSGDWNVGIDKIVIDKSSTTKSGGQYTLIFLQVTNLRDTPEMFIGYGAVQVRNAEGGTYDPEDIASDKEADKYGIPYETLIQPSKTEKRLLAFDLPFDSASYYLIPGSLASDNGQSLLLEIPK